MPSGSYPVSYSFINSPIKRFHSDAVESTSLEIIRVLPLGLRSNVSREATLVILFITSRELVL